MPVGRWCRWFVYFTPNSDRECYRLDPTLVCYVSRSVFQRYVEAHPHSRAFLKWARWEDKQSQYALAR